MCLLNSRGFLFNLFLLKSITLILDILLDNKTVDQNGYIKPVHNFAKWFLIPPKHPSSLAEEKKLLVGCSKLALFFLDDL